MTDAFKILVKTSYDNREKGGQIIHNASRSHAKILFEQLFDSAIESGEDMRIVSGNLDDAFYEVLTTRVKECLDSGVKVSLSIIDKGFNIKGSRFAQAVESHENGSVYLTHVVDIKAAHFVTVGDSQYRLEVDHAEAKAIANFNDTSVGKTLMNAFDAIIANQHKVA